MQTFLPYVGFEKTAQVLDYRRLGKQRVEAYQLLNIVTGRTTSAAWRRHPAALMWRGYPRALLEYGFTIAFEWRRRGYQDFMVERFNSEFCSMICEKIVRPHWLGDQRLHSSHRASLLAKEPAHYQQFRWKETPEIDYYWPAPAELSLRTNEQKDIEREHVADAVRQDGDGRDQLLADQHGGE